MYTQMIHMICTDPHLTMLLRISICRSIYLYLPARINMWLCSTSLLSTLHLRCDPSIDPSFIPTYRFAVIRLYLSFHLSIRSCPRLGMNASTSARRRACARTRRRMRFDSVRSAVDSAAVATNANDSKTRTDSRPDPRAGRPRRYRPVRSAQRHASALGSRATPRAALSFFLCDGTHACVGGDCMSVHACVRAYV